MPPWAKPAAAPHPVGVEAIRQRHPQAKQAEIFPRPAFSHRAGGNRGGRVHEHHHEEEQRHHADVFHCAAEKESFGAEQAVGEYARGFPRGIDRCAKTPTIVEHRQTRAERRIPTRRHRTVPPIAPADREAIYPERKAAERIDHQIHRRSCGPHSSPGTDRFRPT